MPMLQTLSASRFFFYIERMSTMMYKHQIEQMITENQQFLTTLVEFGRTDDADHVADRIRSLEQLLPDAPSAVIPSSAFVK